MACPECKEDLINICYTAACKGHLPCLIWAHKNGHWWGEAICSVAADRGYLQCLMWARENGCPWNKGTCASAAEKGHLDCLMWARKNWSLRKARTPPEAVPLRASSPTMVPWDERTCSGAASNGHLDCLMWARKNGCPWDKWVCTWATEGRNLDCLIWARKHGCAWDEKTCHWAKQNRKKDILKWIHRNGSPCACGKDVYIKWDEWEKDEECNICLEKLDETTVKFCGCRHRYHKECMDTMLKEMNGKKGCSVCARGK